MHFVGNPNFGCQKDRLTKILCWSPESLFGRVFSFVNDLCKCRSKFGLQLRSLARSCLTKSQKTFVKSLLVFRCWPNSLHALPDRWDHHVWYTCMCQMFEWTRCRRWVEDEQRSWQTAAILEMILEMINGFSCLFLFIELMLAIWLDTIRWVVSSEFQGIVSTVYIWANGFLIKLNAL